MARTWKLLRQIIFALFVYWVFLSLLNSAVGHDGRLLFIVIVGVALLYRWRTWTAGVVLERKIKLWKF